MNALFQEAFLKGTPTAQVVSEGLPKQNSASLASFVPALLHPNSEETVVDLIGRLAVLPNLLALFDLCGLKLRRSSAGKVGRLEVRPSCQSSCLLEGAVALYSAWEAVGG